MTLGERRDNTDEATDERFKNCYSACSNVSPCKCSKTERWLVWWATYTTEHKDHMLFVLVKDQMCLWCKTRTTPAKDEINFISLCQWSCAGVDKVHMCFVNVTSFHILITFLMEVSTYSDMNPTDSKYLAVMFSLGGLCHFNILMNSTT